MEIDTRRRFYTWDPSTGLNVHPKEDEAQGYAEQALTMEPEQTKCEVEWGELRPIQRAVPVGNDEGPDVEAQFVLASTTVVSPDQADMLEHYGCGRLMVIEAPVVARIVLDWARRQGVDTPFVLQGTEVTIAVKGESTKDNLAELDKATRDAVVKKYEAVPLKLGTDEDLVAAIQGRWAAALGLDTSGGPPSIVELERATKLAVGAEPLKGYSLKVGGARYIIAATSRAGAIAAFARHIEAEDQDSLVDLVQDIAGVELLAPDDGFKIDGELAAEVVARTRSSVVLDGVVLGCSEWP